MQRLYEEERLGNEQARTSFMKLLHQCQVLRQRFEECNINLVSENEDDLVMDHPSCSDALNLLMTYDNQINFLLAEVEAAIFIFTFQDISHFLLRFFIELKFCDSCLCSGKWHVKLEAFHSLV